MRYTYITGYKDNDKLRKSFNELTEKVYCFNFENWYTSGFWGEKYIPHSIIDGETVVANISVNLMEFNMEGTKKHYIQIGTVMTDEKYREQGLSRYLFKKVIDKYKDRVDGIYLFANDSVLDFYPKFGFKKINEYKYSKSICSKNNFKKIEQVNMTDKVNCEKFLDVVRNNSISNDRLTMDNLGLIAFWTTGFMSNSVYYLDEEDSYIIAEINEETLFIHQIIAEHKVDLEKVISSFGSEVRKVILGFTPYDVDGYTVEELHKEDCTLFILGQDLKNIEKKKLMFPTLSHA